MDATLAPFDRSAAERVLSDVCRMAGLDATGAELVRLGSNAVFRLRSAPLIVRIGRTADLISAEREIAVAEWLAAQGVPAVRPARVRQPLVTAGRVSTIWDSAGDNEEYGTTEELASILRQLHGLGTLPATQLPGLDPLVNASTRIGSLRDMADDDLTYLYAECERQQEEYRQLCPDLPIGVIHGDANVGNVLRDRAGAAMLADLDGFVTGPREWDLVLTAMYFERFGWHTKTEYRAFVDNYGYDVMGWPGYPVMRAVRELLMVVWLAQSAPGDTERTAEVTKRLRALRSGASRSDWLPF